MIYRPTIGLEIHAELNTQSKMFCACKNAPEGSEPNTLVCPVCVAHPGALPTVNKKAVEHVLKVGAAIGGTFAEYSEFDRKSYFYPDMAKGYQISQYEYPLITGGVLNGVQITRIHLEEDTARSSHVDDNGGESLVDFNRAGVPLMELVTEPHIHDAATASGFARALQLLLRTLEVSGAELSKGEMRVEANISVSKTETLGTKVEVKNLNSFKAVEKAISFEIERQIALLESGKSVVQETRGWDEKNEETFSQRLKEGAADYRYFPEPDFTKFSISSTREFSQESVSQMLPELPWHRVDRYVSLGLGQEDALYLAQSKQRADFFDALGRHNEDTAFLKLSANYMISELAGWYAKREVPEFTNITPECFAKVIELIQSGRLSSRGAKDLFGSLLDESGDPEKRMTALGLEQVQDTEALKHYVNAVIEANPAVVLEYKAGKGSVIQYLVGQAMKESRGSGNPQAFLALLEEQLQY